MSKRAHKKQRFAKPYFSNKQKKTATLHATSNGTGLRHSFKDIAGWEQYSQDKATDKARKIQDELLQSLPFFEYLDKFTRDLSSHLKPFQRDVFRFANPMYTVTSIAGSLGDGGRFNIGSAQMIPEFPTLTKAGCLYVASSAECALLEAVKPHGVLKMYKLAPKKSFQLWDLNSVITDIGYPNLLELVKTSGGEALWTYRKTPAIPQILAVRLRNIGGDGILFESTKLSGHSNIAFFFKTDAEADAAFDVQQIPH